MLKVYAGLAVVVIAAQLGAVAWYVNSRSADDPFAPCRQSAVAGGAGDIGGPFTLVDQTGRTVTEKDILDKPALVYFGYTFCPDVCPMDNLRNVEAVELLREKGIDVTPVFISVDPARDTPEVMADYAMAMDPSMQALTGSAEQVRDAARAWRVYYKAQEERDGGYLVDHMTFTYLMHPEHGFLDFFRRELSPGQLAEQVACFLDRG